MTHDYSPTCTCYRCKGIRNTPPRYHAPRRKATFKAYRERRASHEEQHARYLDCGPQNWDDKD